MVKALVADNNGFIREQLKQAVKKAGVADFAIAVDGVDAVRNFEREKPDLVVIDAAIDRLDGLEATRKMKEIRPDAKIILVSVQGSDLSSEAANAGADRFLQHPFEKGKLAEAVEELVG